ncbi:wound-responsive family protein [Abeliophyllum distichum]|uniref:Wound-responsive family protein n=1 Tax=Abeliophyllum distichum TaxID=126358 RepID=A0ABD1S8S9_9LAMI
MAEGGGECGPNSGLGPKPASTFESAGGRLRFTVELKPGETTIVSWKKLLRDAAASKPNGPGPLTSGPSSEAHHAVPGPAPASSFASSSKSPAENGAKDSEAQPGSNRLSNVIERIERMYAGNGSGDEEDIVLDDVPDDDEYDTDDSFIDDTELDDYFQVDNLAIKHNGYFINRGKLEHIEPTPNEQPKKRSRKDVIKGNSGSDDGRNPNKHMNVGKKGGKAVLLGERNSISESHRVAVPNVLGTDVQMQNQVNACEASPKKKRTADTKSTVDSSRQFNGIAARLEKDNNQSKTVGLPLKNHGNRLKESTEFLDTSNHQMSNDKNSYSQSKFESGTSNKINEPDQSIPPKAKGGMIARPDLNTLASKDSLQTAKMPLMHAKEGSSARWKSSMLEKAIRELEKTVAESRPPSTEVKDADNPSQAGKRRLPPEIKQKLAKVARIEQATHGKISNELINHLMSIVGHLMQLRTLKRNLRVMVKIGQSAKQENYDRVQQMKKEVEEMIKMRVSFTKPKVLGQQTGDSDDFQEVCPQEKEAQKRKYNIDDALEDKICDLYELYVEGLEEDYGPPVKKLYAELAALWPNDIMDKHGIKCAIYRAKDRRAAICSQHKNQENIKKRKKNLAPKAMENVRGETTCVSQPVLSTTVANAAVLGPVTLANGPNADKPKPEKLKGNSSNSVDTRTKNVSPRKKLKRKPEMELVEARFQPEKPTAASREEDRHKHHKQLAIPTVAL